jgi:hypothetical protein
MPKTDIKRNSIFVKFENLTEFVNYTISIKDIE